ncbi:hypothetical protein J5TS2_05300 [Brevibacillus halotolerans]|uniref:RICIN domain-containing protein n=2 Tax=Brevibacillus TaxID=55080 RepID=UPI001AFD8A87|nr:RICIN domain-containing protein [Brevibacillus halotolerans]GIN99861.1 hypothetical protein J5TS2_05300 [Brevibacillus halotolerans]
MNFKKNGIYKIINKKSHKVIGVSYGGTGDGDRFVIYDDSNTADQHYMFFSLDSGYVIVPRHSGRSIAVSYGSNQDGAEILQWKYSNAKDQQWYFDFINNDYYFIRNNNSGKVIGVSDGSETSGSYLIQWQKIYTADDQQWYFKKMNEEFPLPILPVLETLEPAPRITSATQNLVGQTKPVTVGAIMLPFIMVQDNNLDLVVQLTESPYYVLEHQRNWVLLAEHTIPKTEELVKELTVGMKTTDQESMARTLNIDVGADLGLNIGGLTAGLKLSIVTSLSTTLSHTREKMTEIKVTRKIHNPYDIPLRYASYGLQDIYVLKRTNGEVIGSWSVKDPNNIHDTTYP